MIAIIFFAVVAALWFAHVLSITFAISVVLVWSVCNAVTQYLIGRRNNDDPPLRKSDIEKYLKARGH